MVGIYLKAFLFGDGQKVKFVSAILEVLGNFSSNGVPTDVTESELTQRGIEQCSDSEIINS